ncbi:unnamed protein product [Caenorhabditis bovis]|uniref:Uncharacterized protein n=1 Tax=Caenorhabditis bovis TaxID=2654633 RepID=A0A8S1EGW9_9PELO|nr:unnamed protein product [Caenorhabditis bovis]
MNHWIITVLALFFVAGAVALRVTGENEENAVYSMPLLGLEKKWSRREPSIRFFKRGGQLDTSRFFNE